MKDFAILSHVLPPSPSGQAIILYRLLKDFDPSNYYLISKEDYSQVDQYLQASKKLDTTYYSLGSSVAEDHKPTPHNRKLSHRKIANYLLKAPLLYNFIKTIFNDIFSTKKLLFNTISQSQKIYDILCQEPARILIVCTGDVNNLPAALLACRRANVVCIPYIFDDFVYQWSGITRLLVKLISKWIFKNTKNIIVTNEAMNDIYHKRYDTIGHIIRNLCTIPNLSTIDDTPIFDSGSINIVYAGAIYLHQDALANLVNAIKCLGNPEIKLHIYTNTSHELLQSYGIVGTYVQLHQHVPQQEIMRILHQADILFLPLAFQSRSPHIVRTASPGKMGEYMALARPILVHAPSDSYISRYFRENDCGIVVDNNSIDELTIALDSLIKDSNLRDHIRYRARNLASEYFALDKVQYQFSQLIQHVNQDQSSG